MEKGQQKEIYSREEVIKLLTHFEGSMLFNLNNEKLPLFSREQWIKDNLKKEKDGEDR